MSLTRWSVIKRTNFVYYEVMIELISLHAAAALVGKSEVTIRRLITAGILPVHKIKAVTGLVNKIDPNQLRAYYAERDAVVEAETIKLEPSLPLKKATDRIIPIKMKAPIVPVAAVLVDENLTQKYDTEVLAHTRTRKELEDTRLQVTALHGSLPEKAEVEHSSNLLIVFLSLVVISLLAVGAFFLFK